MGFFQTEPHGLSSGTSIRGVRVAVTSTTRSGARCSPGAGGGNIYKPLLVHLRYPGGMVGYLPPSSLFPPW